MQAAADVQATTFRKVNCAPAGLGVGWMLHLLPFHRSARLPALEFPTAVHAEGELQATENRAPPPCDGLGVVWTVHPLPFHRSARVFALGVKALEPPTAVQAVDDVHATPDRNARAGGLGAGWICQPLPFHRSTSVLPSDVPPTAVHADAEEHD